MGDLEESYRARKGNNVKQHTLIILQLTTEEQTNLFGIVFLEFNSANGTLPTHQKEATRKPVVVHGVPQTFLTKAMVAAITDSPGTLLVVANVCSVMIRFQSLLHGPITTSAVFVI